MPSLRQTELAKALIDNVKNGAPLNKQEIVASVGYTLATADKKATEIIESKGTQQALSDLGFSEEGARKVVEKIMYDGRVKPEARLKATDQVFKVTGAYAPEKSVNLNLEVNTTNPKALELAQKYEEELKQEL